MITLTVQQSGALDRLMPEVMRSQEEEPQTSSSAGASKVRAPVRPVAASAANVQESKRHMAVKRWCGKSQHSCKNK